MSTTCERIDILTTLRPVSHRANGMGYKARCATCGWEEITVTQEQARKAAADHAAEPPNGTRPAC